MKKGIKIITLMIILNIIFSILVSFKTYKIMATDQTISSDINLLDNNLYPEIKNMINNIKNEHPNWNFKILYTDIEWKDAITYEYMGHENSPKNLVSKNDANYGGEWVCPICKQNCYDSGNWVCASEAAIKYMMDPRNSLNVNDIFQFLELSYNSTYNYNQEIVSTMLKDSFLDDEKYVNTIMEACKEYNANPYYIVARIFQEQKKNGTTLTQRKWI